MNLFYDLTVFPTFVKILTSRPWSFVSRIHNLDYRFVSCRLSLLVLFFCSQLWMPFKDFFLGSQDYCMILSSMIFCLALSFTILTTALFLVACLCLFQSFAVKQKLWSQCVQTWNSFWRFWRFLSSMFRLLYDSLFPTYMLRLCGLCTWTLHDVSLGRTFLNLAPSDAFWWHPARWFLVAEWHRHRVFKHLIFTMVNVRRAYDAKGNRLKLIYSSAVTQLIPPIRTTERICWNSLSAFT